MTKFTDPQYLKTDQYRDSTNLDARAVIHQRFSTNPYGWFHWIFDVLEKLPERANILELGCGPAYLWRNCIERIPAGWRITLSDLSPGMVDAAWRNLVVTGRNFKFEQIDAQSVPYPAESFDAVIANHMLYHVPDRHQAIGEIARVLKPGGHLFATTVGQNHLCELHKWLQHAHIDKSFEEFSRSFTLENGLEQLKPFFSEVTLIHYEDNLVVTEVEPIMAYIRSSIRASELAEEAVLEIHQDLEKELRQNASIFIRKDSGLFEAIK
ncbi:MAG TPA: class I SAM-dependent methyltransferase [Anaerolineales bacterium]|nr:class I SAM-dependent methyltransferase [Anaerolineales bacterium]